MPLTIRKQAAVKGILTIFGVLVLGLMVSCPQSLYSEETGFKYFKNYSYKEYDHHAQNWGIVQAKNGIIYVANQGGVLEFDGVSWRVIDVPNYTVRSIAIAKDGTIYIGGKNEIGFLAPGKTGTLQYVSLLDRLKEKHKIFPDVWKTYAAEKGVYFHTAKFLFRWDSQQMKVWEAAGRFYFSFLCAGKLFIRQENTGLMEMINDSLKPVPGGEMFTTKKIYMIVPYDSRGVLIGTDTDGFFLYNGTAIIPFPTKADEYLQKNRLYHGIRLSSGDLALATLGGGLVIMDPRGEVKQVLDKTSGLLDNRVHYVFEDRQGNLWLALDKGISRIEYGSPFSLYDDRYGLPGTVLAVARLHDDLYAGTVNGLYYFQSHSEAPAKFRPVPGIKSSCWSLLSTGDSILAATSGGVFQVRKGSPQDIVNDPSYVLLFSRHSPGRAWCGTGKGIIVFVLSAKKDRWEEEYRFETINQQIRYIAEEENGSLWLVTVTGGVLRVDFPVDLYNPVTTWYETSNGLPGGRIYAAHAAGHVMFAAESGIFRFEEKKNAFIPDVTLGSEFTGGSQSVFRIVEDRQKNIWFHSQSRNYQAIPGPGASYTIYSTPFLRIPLVQVNSIYPDPGRKTTWFASFDGLIRYNAAIKKNYRQEFQTLVRRVIFNGHPIFDGYRSKTGKNPKRLIANIDYRDRKNIRFEFAAPFFEEESGTRYRYFLEGHDEHWSGWMLQTAKDFTTLDPGTYSFRVQASNIYRHTGVEDLFRFRIFSPWYQTVWAFLGYGFTLLLLMFLVVKWRSRKLEQEKQKLERIIKERTKEVQEKNRILENQTLLLKDQSEKLKEMDRVKSRFFANISHEFRTPLTLIMGPLEQMYAESRENEQKDRYGVMLRNSQQLLTLINQLLELSRFESGRVKLHASCQNIVPFLKGIMAAFRMLAEKNRVQLDFHSDGEDISLYFDPRGMEEAMNNLLINAFKFTPAGGKITVSVSLVTHPPPINSNPKARRAIKSFDQTFTKVWPPAGPPEAAPPDFLSLSVSDTGIGIAKEQLNYIFDRFYQVENLKEKGNKGTGIGLALTKEIVLLHHGKIDVHSQEGKGTEFVIRLPLGREHLKLEEIAAASEQSVSGCERSGEIEALLRVGEGTAGTADNGGAAVEEGGVPESRTGDQEQEKSVILVVEDHVDVRKYIRGSLEPFYRVEEAGDGKEGIARAKEIIPDLIVSDIMMPGVDGNELCRTIKNDIKTSHIPVILLTAKASEESIIQGLETGADDYITKPFNSSILMARIRNLIELRSQLQQRIQKQMLLQPVEISVSSMDREFIKELQGVIEKNLADPEFHVEELSQKLYMNRATLYRKMKALTGETPTEFIRSYRLKRAAQLLRDNFGNVSEVSLAVGFSNMAYFAERFKEKFQQLPSSYQASESK